MKGLFECGMAKEINNQLVPETQQVNHGQVQQTQHAVTLQKCKVTITSGFVGARLQDNHCDNSNEIKPCPRGSGKHIPNNWKGYRAGSEWNVLYITEVKALKSLCNEGNGFDMGIEITLCKFKSLLQLKIHSKKNSRSSLVLFLEGLALMKGLYWTRPVSWSSRSKRERCTKRNTLKLDRHWKVTSHFLM